MVKPEVRVVRRWCPYEKSIIYIVQSLRSNFFGIKSYRYITVKTDEYEATKYAEAHYDYLVNQYKHWLESDKETKVIWKKP